MFDKRHAPRHEATSPVTFRVGGLEGEGVLVNLSGSGALFRFDPGVPLGPETVGLTLVFTGWHDVGALLRPEAVVVRYFEEPGGKLLAVRYLPD